MREISANNADGNYQHKQHKKIKKYKFTCISKGKLNIVKSYFKIFGVLKWSIEIKRKNKNTTNTL